MSLLVAGATPGGILAAFARHAGTALTVKGSGQGTEEVSESPLRSTSTAVGGLISAVRWAIVQEAICDRELSVSVVMRFRTGQVEVTTNIRDEIYRVRINLEWNE